MKAPEIPANEVQRIEVLRGLDLLDTPPEKSYDAVTKLAKAFFDVPIAAISLVDSERQWFKSIQGLDVCETSREVSFCGHTILQNEILQVVNATQDERFHDNPLVTGAPHIRFYAGYPLKSEHGIKIGTLCVIDTKPRKFTKKQLSKLKLFVALIESELLGKRKANIYLSEVAKIQKMYISGADHHELYDYILKFLLNFTNSEYGFIGTVLQDENNQPYLKTLAITNIAWNKETRAFYKKHAPQGMEFRNLNTLFGYTIRTGKQIIANDPKNHPKNHPESGGLVEGHPSLNAYLGMPIFGKNGLVAMFGIANRPGGYSNAVVKQLHTIRNTLTAIIESTYNFEVIDSMAKKDSLTNVYNRFYFMAYMQDLVKKAKKDKSVEFCLLLVDLNRFKRINDYYGHPTGDRLLIEFAQRIKPNLKNGDFVARIGGDEFVVLLQDIKSNKNIVNVVKRIISLSKNPYVIKGKKLYCTASIGYARYPASGRSVEELFHYADFALYQAKQSPLHYVGYTKDLSAAFHRKLDLEKNIVEALEKQSFYCLYQPQMAIKTGKIRGIEALLRWQKNGKQGTVLPQEFVPIIEQLGFAEKLNHMVIQLVLAQVKKLKPKEPIKVGINISPDVHDFYRHIKDLVDMIAKTKLPKNIQIEFEITEESYMKILSHKEANKVLLCLNSKGITMAIDDFGIKYSSINRLLDKKFRTIKIDRAFIKSLVGRGSKVSKAVVRSILFLSNELDIQTIAEGVETKEQLEVLQSFGCSSAQGFYHYKPMTFEKLVKLIQR